MAIYAVHVPSDARDAVIAAEKTRFLKQGFLGRALFFGPLWLLAKRLWRPLALWVIAAALVGFCLAIDVLSGEAVAWLYLLSAVYLGLEGRAFEGAALARRGMKLADMVVGPERAAAEQQFFSRTLAPSEPRQRSVGPLRESQAIIGLFPEAGR
jgi:hypothetical protein